MTESEQAFILPLTAIFRLDLTVCPYPAKSQKSSARLMQKSQPAIYSLCVFILLLFGLTRAIAADIDVKQLDNGSTLIAIDGEFELSDVDTFRTKVASLSTAKVTVALRSEGGRLVAGIRIGALIREKKFTTVVPDGASCASACALAWLGGTRRFVGHDSSVGFHAAYILKSYGPTPSGSGNAALGAYLNQLGLSEKAILYITQTPPTSIRWMNLEDAAEHGIAVALLSPHHAAPGSNTAGIGEQIERSPEQRASEVVRLLVARSSGPSAEVLPSLEGLYAERVLYYGRSTSRQAVLLSKHRLADRWTERAYAIRSLSATCAGVGRTCRVKGVMSWKYFDANTTSRSRGVASFEYRVALAGEAPQIVAETRLHERPPVAASPLKKAQLDFRQLLAKVSKLIP
jgi:hypothetical protein